MKTTKIKLQERNSEVFNFNAWLENQENKVKEVAIAVEENRTIREVTTNFSISASILVHILNAGTEGITVGELMKKKPFQNEKEIFSMDSVGRDFNTIKNYPLQYRQRKLNEAGYKVGFIVKLSNKANNLTCKGNNHITLVSQTVTELMRFLEAQTNWNESFLTE